MGCNRLTQFSKTPKWAAAWHRQRCAECRVAARADQMLERGVTALRGEDAPAAGLASTLAALSEMPLPGVEAPSRAVRWAPRLAAAGAACAVVALMAGYVLNNGAPPLHVQPLQVQPPPDRIAKDEGRNGHPPSDHDAHSVKTKANPAPSVVNGPKPKPVVVASDAVKERKTLRHARSNNLRRHSAKVTPKRETAIAALPPDVDKSFGYREYTPDAKTVPSQPDGLGGGGFGVRPLPEQVGEKHVTVVASYGVDGNRQVKLALSRRYVIREQSVEVQPSPQHVYVIDRVSVTPREPQVASLPGRAKESQVW
jgi:hypothetical protein